MPRTQTAADPNSIYFRRRNKTISAAVVHNTGGDESIEADNDWHRLEAEWTKGVRGGAPHIAYHFWLPQNSVEWLKEHSIESEQAIPVVVWCNHLFERTWHATDGNDEAVGIACQIDGEKQDLSPTQKAGILWLLDTFLPTQGAAISRSCVFGHGECFKIYGGGPDWKNNTVCPGKYVLPWVRSLRKGV